MNTTYLPWTLCEVNLAALVILKDPLHQSLTHKTKNTQSLVDRRKIPFLLTPITVADFTVWMFGSMCVFSGNTQKWCIFQYYAEIYLHISTHHSHMQIFLFDFLDHYFMCVASGTNYSSLVYIHQLWQNYGRVLPEGFEWQRREMLFLRCVERCKCSTAESESSVDRSVEVKQTMQQRPFQCGSRLCRRCVLELYNALAWARKWHIP